MPGPACYQHGGEAATISDANLMLGRLPTDRPLAGGLILSRALAEQAFRDLTAKLGTGGELVALADGVVRIAVAKMAGAVREVSVHRGFDPRDFALLGFGGAGPMHALLVAEELTIPRVLIPRFPGHLSALGQLLADLRRDFVLAWGGRLGDLEIGDFRARAGEMRDQAATLLADDGFDSGRQAHDYTVDMRFVGQSYTLSVPCDPDHATWGDLRAAFAERHERTFGHADAENDAELVNIRLVSRGIVDKPDLSFVQDHTGEPLIEHRRVWFNGEWADCPVFDRAAMPIGFATSGPAIIEEAGGTSVVPPRWHIVVHASGTLECSYD